ncbi:hypothetical protein GPS47_01005 [Acinetobacter haemolyticus]|uniref:hypothetical protein n=1 Tax=Acinetobacter TaxID=469 RepID=UPI000F7409A1|nr:hypothetical protein [Acinetobacter haemolyticus]NAS04213.1 hypothetical protein [Acinetobacter haemolyticus]RSN78836.1 hypothetical protein EA769_00345 [Acinetobacter haemolyticus]
MNSTADELQLIEKIKASYQDVISDLPPTEVLPRHVKFSEYCQEQRHFLDALLKAHSALSLSCQLIDSKQQAVSLSSEQLEQFNSTTHLDWSLRSLSFDLTHAAIFISLCFQDDLKQMVEEHRPPRKPILSFKNLAILLISCCMLGISLYLFNQAPEWLVFIIFAVGFLGLCMLYDSVKDYVQYNKVKDDPLKTLIVAGYFAEHLEDYATQTLILDKNSNE